MKLFLQADLEVEHESHLYRLISAPDGLEFVVPSVAAATALLGIAEAEGVVEYAEQALQAIEQTVKVTYRGVTLMTLGSGSWSAAAVSQALKWLK